MSHGLLDSVGIGSLESHLFGIDDVHNNSSLQHTCQASLDSERISSIAVMGAAIGGGEFSCHSAVVVDHGGRSVSVGRL